MFVLEIFLLTLENPQLEVYRKNPPPGGGGGSHQAGGGRFGGGVT